MPLSNYEFSEGRPTLHKVQNYILSLFHGFSSDLGGGGSHRGDAHENVSNDSEFHENWRSELQIFRDLEEFQPILSLSLVLFW